MVNKKEDKLNKLKKYMDKRDLGEALEVNELSIHDEVVSKLEENEKYQKDYGVDVDDYR